MTTHPTRANGFGAFFRRYTKTWVHAVATAGLTAFGMLTFVHQWFALLALGTYVVPPLVLYTRRRDADETTASVDALETDLASANAREGESSSETGETTTQRTADATATESERNVQESEPHPSAHSGELAVSTTTGGSGDGDEPDTDEDARTREDQPAREDAPGDGSLPARDQRETHSSHWRDTESPTDATLLEVVVVDGDAYAVGAGGVVLADTDSEGRSVVLEDGPGANANDLCGVDATADGEAVWVAGDGGAVGRIDAETGRHTNHSAPMDLTDNLTGIAVGGTSGEETVLLSNGSGEILRGEYDASEGTVAWEGPTKPSSGSSISGVDLVDASVGYCCDTNDGVFETTDGGQSFDRIGLESADGTLVAVAAVDRGDPLVAADDGVVHRYDDPTWTPERVGSESLSGLDRHREQTVVCEGETILERATPTADWERVEPDVDGPLRSVSMDGTRAIAVGDDGTIVER